MANNDGTVDPSTPRPRSRTHTPSEEVHGLLATDQPPPTDAEINSILADALEEKHLTHITSTERLQGSLDFCDPLPTKEELRDMYTDYLEKKYR